MELSTKYPVLIKKNIPFVSEFFLGVFSACCIIIALGIFLFGPSLSSNNEMKVVAGIKIMPANFFWLLFYSGIGLLLFRILYKHIVFTTKGMFSFDSDTVVLSTNKSISYIPISNISRIELIDPTNRDDEYIGKFYVVLYQRNGDILHFRLQEYSDSDTFEDNLLRYDNLKNNIKELNRTFLSDENIDLPPKN